MLRRKKYLHSSSSIPSRTLRRIRQRQRQMAQAARNPVSPQQHTTTHAGPKRLELMSSTGSDGSCSVSDSIMMLGFDAAELQLTEQKDQSLLNLNEMSSEDFNLNCCTSSASSRSASPQLCDGDGGCSDECAVLPEETDPINSTQFDILDGESTLQQLLPPSEHDAYMNAPLFPSLSVTKGEALIMCLALGLRHALSWAAVIDVLKMINALFGEEVVKATKYFFQKYMEAGKGKMTYHLYCHYCLRYLGIREDISEANVGCPCGQTLKDINQASAFFLSLSLGDQILELLQDRDFVDALQHRFKRKKTEEKAYEDLYDGEVYKMLSAPGQVLSHWYNMSYMFNTDGFPVGGKSGKQTCWPIYVQINELPPNLRSKFMLLAGIYVGKRDPDMQIFMYPFVEEANYLSSVGVNWFLNGKNINSKIIPMFACVDTPARSKILNTTAFSGQFGCPLCFTDPESTKVGKRYTVPGNAAVERTHASILVDATKAFINRTTIRNAKKRRVRGVKGPSPLHNLLYFDLVKGVRPDTMHSMLLGNARHHVSVLSDKPGKPYYIGSEVRKLAITKRLLSIKPPASVFRLPREFSTWGSWKATEWRSWLLFYAVPCLYGIIPNEYVHHLGLLSTALHIVLKKSVSESDVETAHILVLRYTFLFQHFYGKEEMVYNIHLLLHLRKSIQYMGPAWTNVAFSFEGANKSLLELKKGASSIAKEIANKYLTFKALPFLCEKYATSEATLNFCQYLSGRPLLKSTHRIGNAVLVGKGKPGILDPQESKCISDTMQIEVKEVLTFQRLLMAGIRYCVSSYSRSTKSDDSYISVRDESRARIQKILICSTDDTSSIVLLVREIVLDEKPLFDDEFGRYFYHKKVIGEGQLLAIRPEDIFGQCVAIFLENGNFICDMPYGCYGDS